MFHLIFNKEKKARAEVVSNFHRQNVSCRACKNNIFSDYMWCSNTCLFSVEHWVLLVQHADQ